MFVTLMMLVRQRLNAVTTGWRRLIQIAGAPYRPELHYMRGPGPKWHAKNQGCPEVVRIEAGRSQAG